MRRRGTERANDSGFTLVEVLISLALISLITVFVANGFDHTRRVATLSEELDGAMTLEAVRSYVAHTLANAHRPPPEEGRVDSVSFAGEPTALAYLAPSDGLLDRGGLYRIGLTGGGDEVRLSRTPVPSGATGSSGERPRTVEAGGLRLRYWGLADGEEAPRWHSSWEGGGALPVLVEIRMEPMASRAVWPPLVVRLLQGG